jgi:hypothetical protein
MPIMDLDCLKTAIAAKGIAYSESGNRLNLNNRISLLPSRDGTLGGCLLPGG